MARLYKCIKNCGPETLAKLAKTMNKPIKTSNFEDIALKLLF